MELDDYNISYTYDEALNEIPEDPEDMDAYAEVLISRSRIEMELPDGERNWLQMASSLGMAGSLRKMTGRLEDAESLLQSAFNIIEKKSLLAVYNTQYEEALCTFQDTLELRLKKEDITLIESTQMAIEICRREIL